ncbi:ComEC family competence protein [Pseudaminobacter arsenicus]|uniref:ComEC family competence protein n=1 Tax=Borborobacter arsenicus TaxID=1851146 RepID=A0A432VB64_9HYPH|nr:ComEC/Rec2 family competence protein [Pseudaminobacter arsenicus]RUM99375.1 ComEC family competence protein [Pseudaminobacter arsenicus]
MAQETSASEVSERALLGYSANDLPAEATTRLPPVSTRTGDLIRSPVSGSRYILTATGAAHALRLAVTVEQERGTAFLLIPVFLALGAIVYFNLAAEPAWVPLSGCGGIIAAIWHFLPAERQAVRFVLAGMLRCLIGALFAKAETWRAGTNMLGSEISTQLTGRVLSLDYMANGRVRLTMDVTGTARPVLRYAPERVRVSARKIPPDLRAGSEVTGLVRLLPPSGPVRPGSYDFSFESYFDGIGASGFFLRGPELISQTAPVPAVARFSIWVEDIRNRIAGRIRGHIGGPEGEIAAALVVGVRAGIPEDINEAMRRSGIYHIISISGLHMALVAGTVMGTLRAIFACFPGFASRHPIKKYAAAIALVGLAFYLFISGAEVAAQRSFIMLAIMLIALLFDRAALTMRNLAISAIIVIAIAPHEVVGPSFQMSFAATAALVGAYALWSERRSGKSRSAADHQSKAGVVVRKLGGVVIGLAVTSVVAGLATTAFGAYHFQRVSPLSLVANLAVMPVVSIVVMPFGVAGSIAMTLGLDQPFFAVMGQGLKVMIALSKWFSERTPIDAVGLVSVYALVFLTIALILATMATTWLRLVALPFVLIGLLMLGAVRTPDAFISEDGRLIALATGSGQLAINRPRPGEFTIENWQRALRAETIIKPVKATATELPPATIPEMPPGIGFVCDEALCAARHPSGSLIAHAATIEAARSLCDQATLIVVADATARKMCRNSIAEVVTLRDLAQFGSAAIYLSSDSEKGVKVRFALAKPYRPWHTQRRFSRAARGLPPYQRKQPVAATTPKQPMSTANRPAEIMPPATSTVP